MRIRALGDLRVDDDEADRLVGRGQAREVLALLVAYRDDPLDTERLVTALWGDAAPPTAATIVHGAVGRLRRALGPDAITRADDGYRLDPATPVDLWGVQDLVAEGRIAEARAQVVPPVLGRFHDRPWAVGVIQDLLDDLGRPADSTAATGRLRAPAAPVSRLVGRRRELLALREATKRSRLVTLVGLGGIGKSRLAAELLVEPEVIGGARVVRADLGQAAGPTSARLAAELGVATLSAADGMATSASVLAGTPTLLLLDGCEHDAEGSADAVAFLLGRCPALRILATSRVALGVPGEQVVPVLPFADPGDPLGDATELLLDRSRALGLPVDHDDREAAAAICRRCAGVPLAIEMASGQLLAAGASTDPSARPPTPSTAVHEVIEAAVATLSEPAATAAKQAGLLPAGFTTTMLDGLTGGRGAVVARELLAAGVATAEGTGQGRRLRFPDPVREQLAAAPDPDDLEAAAALLTGIGERCRGDVYEPVHLPSLAVAATEVANVAAVLDLLAAGGRHEAQLALALSYATAWREDGHWNAGTAQLEAALAAVERDHRLAAGPRAGVVLAIVTVGGTFELAARLAKDLRSAAQDAAEAGFLEVAVALEVRAANGLGYSGDVRGAMAAVRSARTLADRCPSPFPGLYVDSVVALGKMVDGRAAEACTDLAALGEVATANGAFSEAARSHRLASMAARAVGDLAGALAEAEIAEEQAIVGRARGTLAVVRGEIAELRFTLDPASARPALLAALETGSAAGEVRLAGVSRLRLGLLEGDRSMVAAAATELLAMDGRWASLALAHLHQQLGARHPIRRLVPGALGRLDWGAPLSPGDQEVVTSVRRDDDPLPDTWEQDLLSLLAAVSSP